MKVSNRFKRNYCLAAFQHNINKWAHCWSRFNWNWNHVGQTIYPHTGTQKQKNVMDIWKQCYCPENCCCPQPSYMSLILMQGGSWIHYACTSSSSLEKIKHNIHQKIQLALEFATSNCTKMPMQCHWSEAKASIMLIEWIFFETLQGAKSVGLHTETQHTWGMKIHDGNFFAMFISLILFYWGWDQHRNVIPTRNVNICRPVPSLMWKWTGTTIMFLWIVQLILGCWKHWSQGWRKR